MEHFIFFTACLAGAVTGYLIASQVKSQKLASVLRPFFLALFFLLITAVDLHLPWNTPSIRESGWGTSTWLVLGLWGGRLLALAAFTRLAVSTEARPG